MQNVVSDRIAALRKAMKDNNADWYFMTSDDFHGSEYVADYFKIREHYTGFTGENAFLILNGYNAFMWADGRFFIQAENELKGSGVTLMKMGEPGVPTTLEFIKENVKAGESFFFDGRNVNTGLGKRIEEAVKTKGGSICMDKDIAGDLWKDRPDLPSSEVFILSDEVSGENTISKLSRIREKMKAEGAVHHFITSLDDIMWITNLRANDIECNPVALTYLFVDTEDAYIFMQSKEATPKVADYLSSVGIKTYLYEDAMNFLKKFNYRGSVLVDEGSLNFLAYSTIAGATSVINRQNPSKLMKAVKNETEIKRLREAYLLDSVCVTKFAYWLKKNVGKTEITEVSAAEYIDNLRSKVEGFIELSFPTISGYGPNAAMMHYSATPENYAKVLPKGMLLVDSGGQYMNGTTDVTRTYACGPVTDDMKLHFSKVAAGMLNLADAKFLYGCTGRNVDILARLPLWELGIDYKCGTGHGVGYILNVHEGPHNIRWKYTNGMTEAVLEAGMIMSDEPGVYIEGKYGIRTENVILCKKDVNNSDGQFMSFEHLTFTPIDRDLLDKKYLTEKEIKRIDDYHETVYQKTKDYLTKEEAEWLREVTRKL